MRNEEENKPSYSCKVIHPLSDELQTLGTDLNHFFWQTGEKISFLQQVLESKREQDSVKVGVDLIPHGTPAQSLLQLEGAPKTPAGIHQSSHTNTGQGLVIPMHTSTWMFYSKRGWSL